MVLKTKNISIDDVYIDKIRQLIDKHQGNFSAAVRELIDKSISNLPENTSLIDNVLFNWFLKEVDGRLIPDDVLDDMFNSFNLMFNFNSLANLKDNNLKDIEKYLKNKFSEYGWKTIINIDHDANIPSTIIINIKDTHQRIKLIANLVIQFIIKSSSYSFFIRSVSNIDNNIKIELSKALNKKESEDSLVTFFGNMEEARMAMKMRPDFWKDIIHRHLISNYNMVTVHRNYFEDILSGKIPMGEIMIESLAKKPIQDIPLKDTLNFMKNVYETSRVVDKVDINKETLVIFHSFRDRTAIDTIKKSMIALLENNGHLYDAKITSNMIMLSHRPDVGIKINEIVDNLKSSNSSFDQELIMFLSFLRGLKNIPDIDNSVIALGRRIGSALMQEYEKEHNIKVWDLEKFKIAYENIDNKIHRKSEWKLEGKNLLYRISSCGLIIEGDSMNSYICKTTREAFKGGLFYTFGNRAELTIKKLVSHGDSNCEVVIKLNDKSI